jgi:signal transduction histidine kinase
MPRGHAYWLLGGGVMARVIKDKDWSLTPLGPIESWPQSLRTTVSLVQASNSPISLVWGPGHTHIYNDGYWPICGDKHPASMGQDFRECWASSFSVLGEAYATAWAGRSAYFEKMRMFLDRFGFLEETWFTFSFSPIADESGNVGGLFHPVTELTGEMLSERRTRTLRDLAIRGAAAKTAEEALRLSADVFAAANLDVPFTVFYLVDDGAHRARRVAQSGISPDAAGPAAVELGRRPSPWSIAEVIRSGETVQLDDVVARLTDPVGPYPELPKHAFVLPIRQPGNPSPAALLVAGVSARLPLTDSYRMFFELAAGAVASSLANACALDDARRRAEELAELDRAKTAFFSNVSHEFRTPLTLILGPLEDELAERMAPLPAARRQRIEAAHRNSLRLLKLVNTLLDFSRIEAGRLQAAYEPIDLAAETIHLAGVFRSAIEKAGLTLTINCPTLPALVYVDREMWENIVLNLLSNALKYTSAGGIAVELQWRGDHVALRVADTGIGIAEAEQPRLFERFHRVKGAWSRSHEGTGIGLALVRELAVNLGGDASVASTLGAGSVFTVAVKTGFAHLPADRIQPHTPPEATPTGAAFVQEAIQWLPDAPMIAPDVLRALDDWPRPRVVWADDNADMRAYVTGLLEHHFEVVAVPDGAVALREIRERVPDLVLCDVMMPNLDGFALLAALRADPRTRTLPVILLSARAGTESSTEGLDLGADDYVIKPFSARELVARVRTHVALSRNRSAWTSQLERANHELEAFTYSVSHDLRAPLRAISAFTQIVLDDHARGLDQCGLDYLHRIQANAHRMAAIIDDLLALSEVARRELRSETVDLTSIARRIVADLRGAAPSRVVDVRVTDGLVATGDPGLVTIVLENLLANAWKFTGKRRAAAILVGREADDVFFVRDNGAGFDMARSALLFEPFGRLHAETDFAGTGIGLAIVLRVVERHGGRIWAQGSVGSGATIRFTLSAGDALWRPGPRTDVAGIQRTETTALAASSSRS